MFIDTHCHLYSEEFNTDREACIQRAKSEKVLKILLPNIDVQSIDVLYQVEKAYPQMCYAMMGLHPTSVQENYRENLERIYQELFKRSFIGIGEIGMDLYWDKTYLKEQMVVFKTQLEWAIQWDYPVSIHCRDAFGEIFAVLDSMPKLPKGIFHCFTGTLEQAQKIMKYNTFKLGIGGVITYKKSHLPEVLQYIDIKHIVLETDAPYLPPVPYRGKRNEPSYIKYMVEKLAEVKNVALQEIEHKCYENTLEVFSRLK